MELEQKTKIEKNREKKKNEQIVMKYCIYLKTNACVRPSITKI